MAHVSCRNARVTAASRSEEQATAAERREGALQRPASAIRRISASKRTASPDIADRGRSKSDSGLTDWHPRMPVDVACGAKTAQAFNCTGN